MKIMMILFVIGLTITVYQVTRDIVTTIGVTLLGVACMWFTVSLIVAIVTVGVLISDPIYKLGDSSLYEKHYEDDGGMYR
ncbi:MAG: hypothetical protein DRZ76_04555 [Candidatus Nealsonbacteria bacterium]|nr:MAG: hypothetical protein DRZ76_04555 [Candidatus Nealsonbacteria bacterium]